MKQEFHRFLKWLNENSPTEDTAKIANLISINLDELAGLGTAGSKRVKRIVEIAIAKWNSLSNQIHIAESVQSEEKQQIEKLASLKVGPFRGFAKEEEFNLNSSGVLIYGPNGSGKSSFCEALEFALLGSVEEASSKRLKDEEYLKNIYTGNFKKPKLVGVDSEGTHITIVSDENNYRFCFVEKNRIDQFSRMAAFAPVKQTELIATLFGLDAFNEFVKGFSAEIKSEHIDLEGEKQKELDQKSLEIQNAQKIIVENGKSLKELVKTEKELAEKFKKGISFEDFIKELGSSEAPGELQKLEQELKNPAPKTIGVKSTDFDKLKSEIESNHQELEHIQGDLLEKAESLAYKDIYDAVKKLGQQSQEVCPACKTPVANTIENPFKVAESELAKLMALDDLKTKKDERENTESDKLKELSGLILKVTEAISHINNESVNSKAISIPAKPDWRWFHDLAQTSDNIKSPWELLLDRVGYIEKHDANIENKNKERNEKEIRLTLLQSINNELQQLKGSRKTLEDGIEKAKKQISDFDKENAVLRLDAENEKPEIERNKAIASAYQVFVSNIVEYKEQLPSSLIADLGDRVTELYNAFNIHDAPKDKLIDLQLPTNSGERIKVQFQGTKGKYFDALHVLSEGHIRCVGLSILLAKNLKEKSPFLIFDDPVNAIDSEHREAIRTVLFKEQFFKDKQIILTSHGEEFYKDIQNTVPKNTVDNFILYTFLPQYDENHVQVECDKYPRNYIKAASECLQRRSLRDALMNSRRAVENINIRIWEEYRKTGGGLISLSFRQYNKPCDTRTLAEQLKSKFSKDNYVGPKKEVISENLGKLLGISGDSPEWRYLNKGTHEETDREEFELGTVKEIIDALTKLDEVL